MAVAFNVARTLLAVALAVGFIVVLGWLGGDEALGPQMSKYPWLLQHEGASGEEDPGVVRLLVRERSREFEGASGTDLGHELAGDDLIGEYDHKGAIDPGVKQSFVSNCEQRIRELQLQLEKKRDVTSSADLCEEADLQYRLALVYREKQSLMSGSYITTLPDAPAPPLDLPGARVVQTGGMVSGKPVNLTYVFPLATDRELQNIVDYRAALMSFDDSEKARRFNARPDMERLRIAKEIGEILRKADRTREDQALLESTLGWSGRIDEKRGIIYQSRR